MHTTSETTRVVVVTGASSGIGAATARLFGTRGWSVVLAARREERLLALAKEIQATGSAALVVPTDVTQWEQIQRLAQRTWETFHRVDVLVNNAGLGRLNWLDELDPHNDIAVQIQVNLTGAIWVVRAFLPYFFRQGFGHIINVASVASYAAMPTYSVYAATKFGLRGFTEALRREVAPWGIQVSALYPGPVVTEFLDHASGPLQEHGYTSSPKRALSSEEVAETIWELARRPRRGRIVPWWFVPLLWMTTLLPGVVDRYTQRIVRRIRGNPSVPES